MSQRQVAYELRGPAAWIVLDRPKKRNALSPAMLAQLDAALDRAEADGAVRAVVVTGRGKAFCAGADLDTGRELADAGERHPFARLLQRFQTAADVVIAADTASFSFSEVRLGLVPAIVSVVVLPRIGPHHARRLFLTGRRFSAADAVGYGLVHRTTPPGELAAAVDEEVAEIAEGAPAAVADAKRLIREIPRLPEDEAFDRAAAAFAERLRSDEAREGMTAFAEKRPPKWRP